MNMMMTLSASPMLTPRPAEKLQIGLFQIAALPIEVIAFFRCARAFAAVGFPDGKLER